MLVFVWFEVSLDNLVVGACPAFRCSIGFRSGDSVGPVTPDSVTTPYNVTSTDNVTPNLPIM